MIFVTGDTHGNIDDLEARQLKKVKKGDVLIVTGDFGFIWDNSKSELKNIKALSKKKYTILFVEGIYENFDMLSDYEYTEIYGSQVRKIADNIYCLKRGEIYTIENKTVFALGGGVHDDILDASDPAASSASMPTDDELQHAVNVLTKADKKVDVIITHEAPASVKRLVKRDASINDLNIFLDTLIHRVWFDKWYFGNLHTDRIISGNMVCIWQDVTEIK